MILAMQVKEVHNHPNADTLRVYVFGAPNHADTQIVANNENLYNVGDVVAVALVGAVLADGTKLRKARLRGVDSFGMAMGPTDQPVGADLSAQYRANTAPPPTAPSEAAAALPTDIDLIKWPSIEHLHHLIASFQKESEVFGDAYVMPKIPYRAKVKLDGTNAAVQMRADGRCIAQSRSRLIHPQEDNLGFAAWLELHKDYFHDLNQRMHQQAPVSGPILLFGEWCGQGIQKRTAISKIPKRVFAIFAILWGDPSTGMAHIEIEPERLRALIPAHEDIHILPWHHETIEIDFASQASLEQAAETLNALVASVEACDPWVAEVFGTEGLGEGVVMYPLLAEADPMWRTRWSSLLFKAKGEKHQSIRQKSSVQLTPEHVSSVQAFVDLVLTPARLEQALQEACAGLAVPEKIGDFLRWIGQDVKKENTLEAEANGLDWKDIAKPLSQTALRWFQTQRPTSPLP